MLWIIKQFSKTVKPLFSDQRNSSENNTPGGGDNIFTRDAKYVKPLNTFSNLVKNLKIPEFKQVNPFAEEIHFRY